jgi:hypothetical protein
MKLSLPQKLVASATLALPVAAFAIFMLAVPQKAYAVTTCQADGNSYSEGASRVCQYTIDNVIYNGTQTCHDGSWGICQ